jgi:hypothetical protein
VTVDEPGDGSEPAAVQFLEITGNTWQLSHAAERRDAAAFAEHVRVLDHLDGPERGTADGSRAGSRGRHLREVADQQAPHEAALGVDTWQVEASLFCCP